MPLLIMVVLGGAVLETNAPIRHMAAGGLTRLLGSHTTAQIAATYHAVHDAVAGARPRATAMPPSPQLRAHVVATIMAAAATHVTRRRVDATPVLPARAVPATPARAIRRAPRPLVLGPIPAAHLLANAYQVFETWNNCGPASLSMALSYFGIHQSQATLGAILRPYQNAYGDNDDKDVTLDELASEARIFGLLAYHRPSGTIQMLKRFIANGMPVIAETTMAVNDDIGHYRVVKGYDDGAGTITQDDSMQGHNVQFSFADFDAMWKAYNYEYLVLVPRSKQALAAALLGADLNARVAWQQTARMDEAALARNPNDVESMFNLSVADYYLGAYRASVAAFEKVQYALPFRTLWYQIEPIEAYYALGDYGRVFSLTDAVLNNGDRAFSELYVLRGEIDRKQGNLQAARAEFAKAVFYNIHMKVAQDALRSVL